MQAYSYCRDDRETDSSVSPPNACTGRNTSLHNGAATDSLTTTSLELFDPVGNTSLAHGDVVEICVA